VSFGKVLDELDGILREAIQSRQFLQHTVIPRLEALEKGQAELLEIARLTLRHDTDAKALAAWKRLADERRGADEKLLAVRELLSANGCDCECGCDYDGHEDDCERCLACRIADAVRE
jgi:hypothetical protein